MLIDRKEIGSPGAFQGLTDAELAQRIQAAAGRLARLESPTIDVPATRGRTNRAQ
jgi:hypothetical protein